MSAAVQTGSLELLTGCIKHWASEGNTSYVVLTLYIFLVCNCRFISFLFSFFKAQPSSAANLQFVLEWTWKKVIYAKDEFDQICEY